MSDDHSGPDQGRRQFTSPTGTWDEWLAARYDRADDPWATAVATMLRHGLADVIDFGMPDYRTGLRTLFEEFERDTAGQDIVFRAPSMKQRPLGIAIDPLVGQVRVSIFPQDGAAPVSVDLGQVGIGQVVSRLQEAIGHAFPEIDDGTTR